MVRNRLITTLSWGVSAVALLSLSQPILAQDAQTNTPQENTQTDDPMAELEAMEELEALEELERLLAQEELTVTASLITREDFVAPTPVDVVQSIEFDYRLTPNVSDLLDELPSVQAGDEFLGLRNLGSQRSLVLLNGRRYANVGAGETAFDLATLPTALVERVEIVTGGASAAYGSDAIAGVVNVIEYDRYQGAALEVIGGLAEEGGGREIFVSGIAGETFLDERLHIQVGVDFSDRDPVSQSDRAYSSRSTGVIANPLDTGPDDGIPASIVAENVRVPTFAPGTPFIPVALATPLGVIQQVTPLPADFTAPDPLAGPLLGFGPGGALTPFDPGMILNDQLTATLGGDGPSATLEPFFDLRDDRRRLAVAMDAEFEIAPTLTAFTELSYSTVTDETRLNPAFDLAGQVLIPRTSPFIQPDLQAILQGLEAGGVPVPGLGVLPVAAPIQGVFLQRLHADFPTVSNENEREQYRGVFGVEGERAGWSFEGHYLFSRANNQLVRRNARSLPRFLAATGAVNALTGQALPCVGDCIPLNLLGPGLAAPEAIESVVFDGVVEDGEITQHNALARVSGDVFTLPAGPLSVAAGLEYRREDFASSVDPRIQAGDNGFVTNTPLAGDFDVVEVFGEVAVPLLEGLPGADLLELTAAGRFAEYSSVGSTFTWKLGAVWGVREDVRLRATLSRDLRAPSIFELFETPSPQLTAGVTDPCQPGQREANPVFADTCAALGALPESAVTGELATLAIAGNSELDEETATTITAGVVLQPDAVPGFSAFVDYFNIQLEDAIDTVSAPAVLQACHTAPDPLTNPFCAQITRAPNGQLLGVTEVFANLAQIDVSGIDFDITYDREFSELGLPAQWGGFAVNFDATYLLDVEETTGGPQSVTFNEDGEVGLSRWQLVNKLIYRNAGFTGFLQVRYQSAAQNDNQDTIEDLGLQEVDSELLLDVSLRYDLPFSLGGSVTTLSAGIDNLTNHEPPFVPVAQESDIPLYTLNDVYDVRGRFFRFGLEVAF